MPWVPDGLKVRRHSRGRSVSIVDSSPLERDRAERDRRLSVDHELEIDVVVRQVRQVLPTEDGRERWRDELGVVSAEANGDHRPRIPEHRRADVGSKEDYDKLVAAVEEATKKNENIAALRARLTALGQSVVGLANKLKVI